MPGVEMVPRFPRKDGVTSLVRLVLQAARFTRSRNGRNSETMKTGGPASPAVLVETFHCLSATCFKLCWLYLDTRRLFLLAVDSTP